MPLELFTVADDEAVAFDGTEVVRFENLAPDADHDLGGLSFRTLARPGELLARFATVNDVHFGETECGRIEGSSVGPVLTSAPGDLPYVEVMNRAAVAEIIAIDPDVVLAKGDLTDRGTPEQFDAFLGCYSTAFGDKLHYVLGNHDVAGRADHRHDHDHNRHEGGSVNPVEEVTLPGVTIALMDTSLPGRVYGGLSAGQLEWLDELSGAADRPVMVFGHHQPWEPGISARPEHYFGLNPLDSEALVDLVVRRPSIVGYFAGHTHRNVVRHFGPTGAFPWAEVASTKDFPGSWAEYRVHEGGILQVHRRISTPEALGWSEACRAMVNGFYPLYALGTIEDRCFAIWPR